MDSRVIHVAAQEDLPSMHMLMQRMGTAHEPDYIAQALALQAQGKLEILLVSLAGEKAGYCILNWQPKYGLYQRLGIPEIQDVNILPEFRRCGLGRMLIKACEERAQTKGFQQIGISVGLSQRFGAAQILYTKMGYIPDGNGVTYDRMPVAAGEIRPIDDDLCLMMVKDLG